MHSCRFTWNSLLYLVFIFYSTFCCFLGFLNESSLVLTFFFKYDMNSNSLFYWLFEKFMNKNSMSSRRFSSTRIKLSDLSDEDCRELMDWMEKDSEDESNDDTNDPDLFSDEITLELDDVILKNRYVIMQTL